MLFVNYPELFTAEDAEVRKEKKNIKMALTKSLMTEIKIKTKKF